MKHNECFYCLHALEGVPAENTGWYHPCKFKINNESMIKISECPQYYPCDGFQMGGHYTHTHFQCGDNLDDCLLLYINGDMEFPQSDPRKWLRIHICDFEQIERWVEFWGKYLRSKNLIPPRRSK